MTPLPSGTVTFLFTDIEDSTRLAQQDAARWESIRGRHNAILRSAVESCDGHVFEIVGDAFYVAFHSAGDALRAALKSQLDLFAEDWGDIPVRVRMGLHTGRAELQEDQHYRGYLAMCRVQRLMSAAHGGQVLVSQVVQDLVREELPGGVLLRDMGQHRLKDLASAERIYQLCVPGLPSDFPPIKTLDACWHNLPAQLTSFIGREKEMEAVKQALVAHRLVTLTGAGGTGKTRLAIQVAADFLTQYPDGVWLVELAPLSNPEFIPSAALAAFGVTDQPGMTSSDVLTNYLREKNLLILLDNCEHLIEACANLAEVILKSAPEVRLLCTSREALGISGEIPWKVPSLSVPAANSLPATEFLSQFEAVRLFVERASLARPQFQLTDKNAPAVARICTRLDGIPLAIELAAARIKVLSAEQIANRLDDCFHLLAGGSRTALPRHQTLRAAIDWSYNLLSEPERVLFRRLAVFAGGWSLAVAEQICVLSNHELDVLETLSHLVDKSLVSVDETGDEARYHLLETTRQYALEKLAEAGEEQLLRNRHGDWYLKFAQRGDKEIRGPDQIHWLGLMESEHENLLAVLEWSFRLDQPGSVGILMSDTLTLFWSYHTHYNEMFFWLDKALERSRSFSGTALRAKTLYNYGRFTGSRKLLGQGLPLLTESLEIYRNLGETYRADYGRVLLSMGGYIYHDDPRKGVVYMQEALAIFEEMGDKYLRVQALHALFDRKWNEGDLDTASKLAESALALSRECGDRFKIALCIKDLGSNNVRAGNYLKAKDYLEEALELCRTIGARRQIIDIMLALGEIYRAFNDYQGAEAYYRESLAVRQELGLWSDDIACDQINLGFTVLYLGDERQAADWFKQAYWGNKQLFYEEIFSGPLGGFAAVATVRGDFETAAVLFGAVEANIQKKLAEGVNLLTMIQPVDRKELDRYQGICRAGLGGEAFETAMQRGAGMSLDDAIAFALEKVGEPSPSIG